MERDPLTFWTAVLGMAFGLTGAVLGVMNFVRSLMRDKVCLKVFPQKCFYKESGPHIAALVVNRSLFPVTVTQVYLALKPETGFIGESVAFEKSGVAEFPKRLESRASFTVTFPPAHKLPDLHRVIDIEVQTACLKTFTAGKKRSRRVIKLVTEDAAAWTKHESSTD